MCRWPYTRHLPRPPRWPGLCFCSIGGLRADRLLESALRSVSQLGHPECIPLFEVIFPLPLAGFMVRPLPRQVVPYPPVDPTSGLFLLLCFPGILVDILHQAVKDHYTLGVHPRNLLHGFLAVRATLLGALEVRHALGAYWEAAALREL